MSRPTKEATIGEEKIPSVLANLVYIWTIDTSWNLLIIYAGQAFQDGLVHLSLKMDETI